MKDPLDNGRTAELPFEEVPAIALEPIAEGEPEFKTTLTPEQIEAAKKELRSRSFSGRNPELGKMINCPVHGFRHRLFEYGAKPCEQKFTYRIGDYEYFREDTNEEGETKLVPDFRTAVDPKVKPTRNQIAGAPRRNRNFQSPRYNPHSSKVKLLLIQYVREIFTAWEDQLNVNIERLTDEKQREKIVETFEAEAQKYLHRARIEAARCIRKEHELKSRAVRRRQDQSRRINRGLQVKVLA